jgi:hypothetical protein
VGKGGEQPTFEYEEGARPLLPIKAIDLLPGDVLLADFNSKDGGFRYKKIFDKFSPPGKFHTWINNPQTDPSLLICLKLVPAYGDEGLVFSAPFGLLLPDALLGKAFAGKLEYEVRCRVCVCVWMCGCWCGWVGMWV